MTKLYVDNIWTRIYPDELLNEDIVKDISLMMSYKIEEYSRFEKKNVPLEYTLLEDDELGLKYPTGLFSILHETLISRKIRYEVVDVRTRPIKKTPLEFKSKVLRDYQEDAVQKAIAAERGILKIATGGGKTSISAAIITRVAAQTLFVVNSIDLLDQAYDEFISMIGGAKIGRIGGGECDIGDVNICTIQTLHSALGIKYDAMDDEPKEQINRKIIERNSDIIRMLEKTEMIIGDECHHIQASSYVNMMQACPKAYYKLGMCLAPNTLVHLSNGKVEKIGTLYTKNKNNTVNVFTFNTNKNIIEAKEAKVVQSFVPCNELWEIIILNHNNDKIKITCSSEHKFYIDGNFIECKNLKKGDRVNTIEYIKKLCCVCGKELKSRQKDCCSNECKKTRYESICSEKPLQKQKILNKPPERFCVLCNTLLNVTQKIYCSKRCRAIHGAKDRVPLLNKGHKDWWYGMSEDKRKEKQAVFQQAGTESAKQKWFDKTDEEKDIVKNKMSKSQLEKWDALRRENYNEYIRMKPWHRDTNSFFDKERISKKSKEMWAGLDVQQRHDRNIPWIKAGIESQIKMRKVGEMRKRGCITAAKDGHICDSKREAIIDDWLYENNIPHEVHKNIPTTSYFSDFLVQHEGKDFYIEYDGLRRGDDYFKHDVYKRLGLNYLVISVQDFNDGFLDNTLSFLKFTDPIGIIIQKKKIGNRVGQYKKMYDLSILDVGLENQNFFANSVLVHNSATPYKMESKDIVVGAYAGKQIVNISASFLIDKGFLVAPKIYFLDANQFGKYKYLRATPFNKVYDEYIMLNEKRNQCIVDCIERFAELEKTMLVTISRIKHGEILMDAIADRLPGVKAAFIQGSVGKADRKVLLNKIRNKEISVLIGSSVADEGLDLPALDAAIIAGGGRSLVKTIQRVGRTLRPYPNAENNIKKEAIIVDFYDHIRYLTGQSKRRMEIYRQEPRFEVRNHF